MAKELFNLKLELKTEHQYWSPDVEDELGFFYMLLNDLSLVYQFSKTTNKRVDGENKRIITILATSALSLEKENLKALLLSELQEATKFVTAKAEDIQATEYEEDATLVLPPSEIRSKLRQPHNQLQQLLSENRESAQKITFIFYKLPPTIRSQYLQTVALENGHQPGYFETEFEHQELVVFGTEFPDTFTAFTQAFAAILEQTDSSTSELPTLVAIHDSCLTAFMTTLRDAGLDLEVETAFSIDEKTPSRLLAAIQNGSAKFQGDHTKPLATKPLSFSSFRVVIAKTSN